MFEIRAACRQGFSKNEPVSREARLCELTGKRVRFHADRGRDLHDFPLGVILGVACLAESLSHCIGYTRFK